MAYQVDDTGICERPERLISCASVMNAYIKATAFAGYDGPTGKARAQQERKDTVGTQLGALGKFSRRLFCFKDWLIDKQTTVKMSVAT